MEVPYVNLGAQHRGLKEELLAACGRVLERGDFILGKEVEEFEHSFAQLCGTPFAVGVNSGTDALVLALRALKIGPGDEVITAPNSFVASTSCIRLVGAKPVFADIGDDMNLDPAQVESRISAKTKAILPVHLTGRPAEMTEIMKIAERHHLQVVEDCAQAVLAEHHGKRVGSFGAIGCFSLHPLKTLNACGDGGVLTTHSQSLYEELKLLRNLGLKSRDNCAVWSSNSRLDTLQAAMLLVKLKYLKLWTEKRRDNARFYGEHLKSVRPIILPVEKAHEKCVYHTYVIRAEKRDELKSYLEGRGIKTAIHYPIPIHLQSAAWELKYGPGSFPAAEKQAAQILSLPVHTELSREQLAHVVKTIQEFYGS